MLNQFNYINILKILLPAITAFVFGMLITPIITHYLYKYQIWKKKDRQVGIDGNHTPITVSILKDGERKIPRMGGLVVVFATLFSIILFLILSNIFETNFVLQKFNFISRNQTWLPIAVFILGTIIGFIDDLASAQIINLKNKYQEWGMPLRYRLIFVSLCGLLSGYWFYFKLAFSTIHIPFYGDVMIGILIIPFFIILFLAIYGASIIDGLDGLSGGIFAIIFGTYGLISVINNQIDIATLCFVIACALLAFLWFNIPPARFYLSEVGYMPLAFSLAVISVITNSVLFLPIIAFPLFATVLTTILQLLSKKIYKRKIFPVTPIHNSLVYIGWSKEKVVMRYWILTMICALIGLALYLIS